MGFNRVALDSIFTEPVHPSRVCYMVQKAWRASSETFDTTRSFYRGFRVQVGTLGFRFKLSSLILLGEEGRSSQLHDVTETEIITSTILGVPYSSYSRKGPELCSDT